jgi:hypothetical protein
MGKKRQEQRRKNSVDQSTSPLAEHKLINKQLVPPFNHLGFELTSWVNVRLAEVIRIAFARHSVPK